ncbi:MAG TPA: hypothetical protein VGE96_00950 [Steroidobacteraceae bacterium]|jgi:hypothetical protein
MSAFILFALLVLALSSVLGVFCLFRLARAVELRYSLPFERAKNREWP